MPRPFHIAFRIGLSLCIVLALMLHVSGFYPLALVNRLEQFAYDVRLRFTLPGGMDSRIVIADIDEQSLLREAFYSTNIRSGCWLLTWCFPSRSAIPH